MDTGCLKTLVLKWACKNDDILYFINIHLGVPRILSHIVPRNIRGFVYIVVHVGMHIHAQ